MLRLPLFYVLTISSILSLPIDDCWGRGRGGGGGGGGGRSMGGGSGGRSMGGGGGFSGGGASRSQGNFGGGGFSSGGFSGGASRPSTSSFGNSNLGSSGINRAPSGANRSSIGSGTSGIRSNPSGQLGRTGTGSPSGTGGLGRAGASNMRTPGATTGNRYSTPNRNQLDGFLGLPSDEGFGNLGSARKPTGDNFDVKYGTAEGPRGGQAGGVAVTGPQGNTSGKAVGVGANGGVAKVSGVQGADGGTAGRGVAVGPNGGVAAGSAVRGADGGAAARGVAVGPDGGMAAGSAVRGTEGGAAARGAAVGPNGRVAAGSAARGPNGGAAARGVVAGPQGAAAGFARVTPSGRYTSATAVRTNYNHWDMYGDRWHTDHPGAWFAAGWATGTAWRAATWDSYYTWMGYPVTTPVYYDYGNNITYQDDSVYVNGESAGTTEEYLQQASEIAQTGAEADAPADGEWLPLGVFALTQTGASDSVVTIELAVNKEGIIRGNYTDTKTDKTQLIKGAVDKETQRVAFTVGDNQSNLIETGIYNLTKDEAPALVHVGDGETQQWLLVRLQQEDKPTS